MEERRREGVTRARYSDGNGGHSDVYTMTINRVKAFTGMLIGLLTLAGMVFAAVRFGVGIEIDNAIEKEVRAPDGEIYRQIEKTSTEVIEEIQGVIQDDLDVLEGKVAEEHDRIIRIEERQISIQRKMESDKQELIQEIRRSRGDS